jgi:hypothetical protein
LFAPQQSAAQSSPPVHELVPQHAGGVVTAQFVPVFGTPVGVTHTTSGTVGQAPPSDVGIHGISIGTSPAAVSHESQCGPEEPVTQASAQASPQALIARH